MAGEYSFSLGPVGGAGASSGWSSAACAPGQLRAAARRAARGGRALPPGHRLVRTGRRRRAVRAGAAVVAPPVVDGDVDRARASCWSPSGPCPSRWTQSYTTNMGWLNVTTYMPAAGTGRRPLGPGPRPRSGSWWPSCRRQRPMMLFGVLGVLSALAVVFEPQGKLYNTRFLPLWWICVYLLAGYAVAEGGVVLATVRPPLAQPRFWERRPSPPTRGRARPRATPHGAPRRRVRPPRRSRRGRRARWRSRSPRWSLVLAFVLPAAAGVAQHHVTTSARSTSGRTTSSTGPSGTTPATSARRRGPRCRRRVHHGPRRPAQTGAGGPSGSTTPTWCASARRWRPMLLPYWTNGCIDSQEGLLFESSATTPYHFIDQAELSAQPSEAVVASTTGIRYGPLDVALGRRAPPPARGHATSWPRRRRCRPRPTPTRASPGWRPPGPGARSYNGPVYNTTWKIYEVNDVSLVSPLDTDPTVLTGVGAGQGSWLPLAQKWYADPPAGASSWSPPGRRRGPVPPAPGAGAGDASRPRRRRPVGARLGRAGRQRHGAASTSTGPACPSWCGSRTSRHGRRPGRTGPWRAAPNLMVVVPTAHDVTCHYGATPAARLGHGPDRARGGVPGRPGRPAPLGLHHSLTRRSRPAHASRPTILLARAHDSGPDLSAEGGRVQLVTRRRSARRRGPGRRA